MDKMECGLDFTVSSGPCRHLASQWTGHFHYYSMWCMQTGGPAPVPLSAYIRMHFPLSKGSFKDVFVAMMDASQRTSCILPAGNPPAGHICICHEKSCFLERGSPVHSVPDTVTTSPRPGLPGRLKSSAKSSRSWKASLLLPEAWLDHLAQPGCPK